MAEAPTLPDISRAPRTDAPPPRFMPPPAGGESLAPAPSPVQPRSVAAALSPEARVGRDPGQQVALTPDRNALDFSQVPALEERDEPKFIRPSSPPVETQTVTRNIFGRLISRLGF